MKGVLPTMFHALGSRFQVWEEYFRYRPSKQLLLACLGFILGIFVHSLSGAAPWFAPIFFIGLGGASIGLFCAWRKLKFRLAFLVIFGILAGAVRYELALPAADSSVISFWNGKTVMFQGIVINEPRKLPGSLQATLATTAVEGRKTSGRVLLVLPRTVRLAYGNELRLRCDLEPLANRLPERVFSVCGFPDAFAQIGSGGHAAIRELIRFKQTFAAALDRALPGPEAALASGLLFGERRMPAADVAAFRATGTSHIIAVSGFNVAIILSYLFVALGWLGIPRRLARAAVFAVLGVFIILTGAPASIIRAGIMGMLPVMAEALGRELLALPALLVTAAIMLAHNPFLLFDVGFLLSFAATAGLIWVAPVLDTSIRWGRRSPYHFITAVRQLFIQTLGAVIATLPIVLAAFGNLSLIAPLANVLVLFVVPFTMAASFLAGLAALFLPAILTSFISLPAAIFLQYLRSMTFLLATIPGATFSTGRLSWLGAAFLYVFLGFIIYRLNRKNSVATETTIDYNVDI